MRSGSAFASSVSKNSRALMEEKVTQRGAPSRLHLVRGRRVSDHALDGEAVGLERGDQPLAVLLVSHHDREVEPDVADLELDALAAVLDLDDVAPLVRDELADPDQLTGAVDEARPHREVAPLDRHRVTEDGDEGRRVDVPARDDRERRPVAAGLAGEERGDTRGACSLDEKLRALEHQRDGLADLVLAYGHEVVEVAAEDVHRELARMLHGDPVGDRGAVAHDLDADEPRLGTERPERDRDPGGKPASPDRDEHGAGVVDLLDDLEPDRSLPRDHELVLEGVDEGR